MKDEIICAIKGYIWIVFCIFVGVFTLVIAVATPVLLAARFLNLIFPGAFD